jgi:hypothetical protein
MKAMLSRNMHITSSKYADDIGDKMLDVVNYFNSQGRFPQLHAYNISFRANHYVIDGLSPEIYVTCTDTNEILGTISRFPILETTID